MRRLEIPTNEVERDNIGGSFPALQWERSSSKVVELIERPLCSQSENVKLSSSLLSQSASELDSALDSLKEERDSATITINEYEMESRNL